MITKVFFRAYDADFGVAVEIKVYNDTDGCNTLSIGYEDGGGVEDLPFYDEWLFAAAIATNSGVTLQGDLRVHLTKSECEKLQEEVDDWNKWYFTNIQISNDEVEED